MFSPKLPNPLGGSGPHLTHGTAYPSHYPKWHLDWFRQTHTQTYSSQKFATAPAGKVQIIYWI